MRTLPTEMIRVFAPFAPLFSERVFRHVQVLLMGAILAPGKRTVSAPLKAMGLDQQKNFHRYHRVLSRAVWSSRREASRVLLELLVEAFVPDRRTAGCRRRRDPGAPPREEDSCQGDLPRPGAFLSWPLRKDPRSQVGMPDAARSGSLDFEGLGLAVPFCPGALRAPRKRRVRKRRVRQTPQAAHRAGLADALASK
jgi:DDE superfamily endonuclease